MHRGEEGLTQSLTGEEKQPRVRDNKPKHTGREEIADKHTENCLNGGDSEKHFPMVMLLFCMKVKKTTSSTDIRATVLESMQHFMSLCCVSQSSLR